MLLQAIGHTLFENENFGVNSPDVPDETSKILCGRAWFEEHLPELREAETPCSKRLRSLQRRRATRKQTRSQDHK